MDVPIADYWMQDDGVVHAFSGNGPGGCVIRHERPCQHQHKSAERVAERAEAKVVKTPAIRTEAKVIKTPAIAVLPLRDVVQRIADMAKAALYEGVSLNPAAVLAATDGTN